MHVAPTQPCQALHRPWAPTYHAFHSRGRGGVQAQGSMD